MKPSIIFSSLFLMACASAIEPVPVMVGGSDDWDACSAYGVIQSIDADPLEGGIAVRSGPSKDYPSIDHLQKGTQIWICSNQDQAMGVVYPSSSDDDCSVSSPEAIEKPYAGACKSGWVPEAAVEILAG